MIHRVPSDRAGSRDTTAPGRVYAVAWRHGVEGTSSGGLHADREGLHLHGRTEALHIPFLDMIGLSIERGRLERLRGLPTIALLLARGETVRIASLEGAGALHEIVALARGAGVRLG